MKKSSVSLLALTGFLSACIPFTKEPLPASLFVTPISATLLAVKIPTRSAEATLLLVARSEGVETWQTGDAVSISLRDGLIVGTRGLGFDVMGSDVQQTLQALSGSRSGQYDVTRSYLSADNHVDLVAATCTMTRSDTDRHYIEDCTAETGAFRNEYWLDGSGRVTQSNQWIGPEVQFLKLSYVNAG